MSSRRPPRLRDLSLGRKVLLLVSVPILALVWASLAFAQVTADLREVREHVDRAYETRALLGQIRQLSTEVASAGRAYALSGDESLAERVDELDRRWGPLVDDLEDRLGEGEITMDVGVLRRALADRVDSVHELVDLSSSNDIADPADAPEVAEADTRNRETGEVVRAALTELDEAVTEELDARQRRVDTNLDRGYATVIAGLGIGVGGGILLSLLAARSFARRLAIVRSNAQQLETDGALEPPTDARDEIGELDRRLHASADLLRERRAALERSERFLDSVIEHLPTMLFVKEADGLRFTRFNAAGEQMVGHSRNELLGRNDLDLFPEAEARHFIEMDRQALRDGVLVDIAEEPITRADGTVRILHTRKIPIMGDDGRPAHLLGISEDITERKEAEAEAHEARRAAIEASAAKSEFLSRMSHELRTPLNAVIGFGQLLAAEELPPEHQDSITQVLRAGRHLLDLINEVLDLSQIESGRLPLSIEPVRVGDVAREVLELMAPVATASSIRLPSQTPSACAVHVNADRQRFKQVLLNLVSNAIKYNRIGGEVRLRCTSERTGWLRVSVSDTGPGIPAEKLDLLFAPFERLGAEASGLEGSGLGLALSQRLTEAMGGHIGVDPGHGSGATFWVELPVVDGPLHTIHREADGRPAIDPTGTVAGTVLYIEDNLSNVRLVEALLRRRPAVHLEVAMLGSVGLDLAIHHRPDLILLDLNLPDRPGEELVAQLQAEPTTRDIPVVIVSADATPGQIARLRASGAADYLTKPFDLDRFLAAVDAHLITTDDVGSPVTLTGHAVRADADGSGDADAAGHLDPRTLRGLRELHRVNRESVAELVDVFVHELIQRLDDLEQAITEGDGEATRSVAHRIIGSSASYGATKLAELAQGVQDRHQALDDAALLQTVAEMRREAVHVEAELRQHLPR